MAGRQYTAAEIIRAIEGSGGIISTVAERLQCDRSTVYRHRDRYPSVRRALEDERARILDRAERKLEEAVEAGNLTAIIFTLKTLGKERGYVERVQVEELLERELEVMFDALEGGLEPDEFRRVTGILARLDVGRS